MSQDLAKNSLEFLHNETIRIQKKTKLIYRVGMVFMLIVAGYMGFILWMVKGFLEPQTLAIIVGEQIEAVIPEIIESAESNLTEQAPHIATKVSMSFIQGVPRVSASGQELIDSVHQEQIPFISREFTGIVEDYIDEHSLQLQLFAEEHQNSDFADYFTESMMTEFTEQLDNRIKDVYQRENGIEYFNQNLLYSLLAIETTLDEILATPPAELSHHQKLQKRILARLVATAYEHGEE